MKQNIETLKEYFETGDKPTQQNYADLIDSLGMPIVGEIRAMSFGFAPEGWKKCNGQLLDPTQYAKLFALIGTTYGGDGTTSFALPNLVARIPLGFGTTSGLSSYAIGQTGGEETHQLTEDEMPSHNHTASIDNLQGSMPASTLSGGSTEPGPTTYPSSSSSLGTPIYGGTTNTNINVDVTANGVIVDDSGNNNSHNIIQPYLAVNYIIAVEGINPS